METPGEISGTEAIRRMRMLKNVPGASFGMMFIPCQYKKRICTGEIRKVEHARLRASLPKEAFETDSDLYLPYMDLDADDARMCFKKLIRWVCFPPTNEWLQVKWFE